MLLSSRTTSCVERKNEREESKSPVHASEAKPSAFAPSRSSPNPASSEASSETTTKAATESGVAITAKAIYLQPLGPSSNESDLTYIVSTLELYFPFAVRRLPIEPLPKEAYYAPRKRYRAERLLSHLERLTHPDAQVVIGLTESDISTTKGDIYDWGVLGLATLSGQQCVISRFRAQRDAKSERHVQERLAKTVVHEVGHTIGLPHCPNHGCIMEDGKGTVKTTDHERDVCASCRSRVGALMLPPPVQLPW